jgi:hypothetical protein
MYEALNKAKEDLKIHVNNKNEIYLILFSDGAPDKDPSQTAEELKNMGV